jgi:hypothetical protein
MSAVAAPCPCKTGLPHGGSRVEFRQVLFIPLHRDNERPSLIRSPTVTFSDRQSIPSPLVLIVAPCVWCYGCLVGILDGCGFGFEWPTN